MGFFTATEFVLILSFLAFAKHYCLCQDNQTALISTSSALVATPAQENVTNLLKSHDGLPPSIKKQYSDANTLTSLSSVQIIPDIAPSLTISQLYGPKKFTRWVPKTQTPPIRHETIISILFERDYDQWNPRNHNSQWAWLGVSDGLQPADNAAMVRYHAFAKNSYGQVKPKWLGENPNHLGSVVLISEPFARYFAPSDPNNIYNANEGYVKYKNTIAISSAQRILFRLKSACKIINADRHPFPSSLVVNPWDDPRLASCAFQVTAVNSQEYYYVLTTNEGVWAVYSRFNSTTAQNFISKRRIGVRKTYSDIVDAGIEIDGRLNVVNWYLNGYRVWSVNTPGVPPPDDGHTKIDLGAQANQTFSQPSNFSVQFGTLKCLDESDPNNPASHTRLVPTYGFNTSNYDANPNATYYAAESTRANNLWGQSAKMRLYKLLVIKADSIAQVPTALPEYSSVKDGSSYDNNKRWPEKKVDDVYHVL